MCGIAGFLDIKGELGAKSAEVVVRMADQLIHRGPDSSGHWCDLDFGIALAHRRLSILELSPVGHQPMVSLSGRYVIVFNGEIYNHLNIRLEIEGLSNNTAWRGHSDTETLLAAIDVWGFEDAIKRLEGMFSFALWDRKEHALILARDRLGEKPLYYGWQGNHFMFASECKALTAHPSFLNDIDRDSLTLFFRYNCIPAPHSIYRGIKKLMPGTYLKFTPRNRDESQAEIQPYWSLNRAVEEGKKNLFDGTDGDAIDALDVLLKQVVQQQMVADVPLGAFLSGGIDSSTIVSLMQSQSRKPIKTFTIGFYETEFNEAGYAKAVAAHLGTEHTELYVTPKEALEVVPKLPIIYDEPFSDSSQIPTFLISQLAKKQVTVSLSGDGGDELFAGYNRYLGAQQWWGKIKVIPEAFRTLISNSLSTVRPSVWDKVSPGLGNRMQKIEGVLRPNNIWELYLFFVSHWTNPNDVVVNGHEKDLKSFGAIFGLNSFVEQMMAMDATNYLPNDILVKVDRAAMALSLETRVPFLDHRVVEFCWRLPLSMKIRNGQTKWLLRQVLYKYVPKQMLERPKRGFALPIDQWLRGPLRDWAENLLDSKRLKQEGYINPVPICGAWEEHLSGKRNRAQQLWDVLMFQAWHESRK